MNQDYFQCFTFHVSVYCIIDVTPVNQCLLCLLQMAAREAGVEAAWAGAVGQCPRTRNRRARTGVEGRAEGQIRLPRGPNQPDTLLLAQRYSLHPLESQLQHKNVSVLTYYGSF